MIEHISHAGLENGRLVATRDQLVEWGIGRKYVHIAIKDAVGRGLIYRTECGGLSYGSVKRPNRYGLGWLPNHDAAPAPNRWKRWHPPKPSPSVRVAVAQTL